MKVLAVIPARGGSKGVPKKNKRTLAGEPLIAYSINFARKSDLIDHLIISTDDDDIIQTGERMEVDIPFKRPPDLASDDTPLISVVLHAYHYFKERNIDYDAVLSLQPTCPFLGFKSIDRMIELWLETGCESVVTISEITKGHPYIAKRLHPGNIIDNFSPIPEGAVVGPRQKREKAYFLTGGAYLRDKRLLENNELKGHALGNEQRAVVVSEIEAFDINTEFDMKVAEFLAGSGKI